MNTSRIHPNSKKSDRNLSPSKVVTFLYVGNVPGRCAFVAKENIYILKDLKESASRIEPNILKKNNRKKIVLPSLIDFL